MKEITSRHRRAVALVKDENRTMASVGREFGVTARTVRRWIDVIYPLSPLQYMTNMDGTTMHIRHPHGGLIPQNYDKLNWKKSASCVMNTPEALVVGACIALRSWMMNRTVLFATQPTILSGTTRRDAKKGF